MTRRDIDRLAALLGAGQHGAVALRQLQPAGGSKQQVHRRAKVGGLVRRGDGLYTFASAVPGWRLELSAAQLAHPGSAVSHRSACVLHRWAGFQPIYIELSSSYSANCRSLGTVHRTKDLLPEDLTVVDSFVVTTEL